MKDKIATGLFVTFLVLVLGGPWLIGVVIGAIRLAVVVGMKTGFDGLAHMLTAEATNVKARNR